VIAVAGVIVFVGLLGIAGGIWLLVAGSKSNTSRPRRSRSRRSRADWDDEDD
jgi:hypothetical protein